MIGCLRTRGHKQPIIALYFETFENELKFYNLEARFVPDNVFCHADTFSKRVHKLLANVEVYIDSVPRTHTFSCWLYYSGQIMVTACFSNTPYTHTS